MCSNMNLYAFVFDRKEREVLCSHFSVMDVFKKRTLKERCLCEICNICFPCFMQSDVLSVKIKLMQILIYAQYMKIT